MNIQQALKFTIERLADFPSCKIDAFCLLKFITGFNDLDIIVNNDKNLTTEQINRLKEVIKRRQKHEPIAHIVGFKEFFGLEFKVTNQTLIPRPESEMMVEKALDIIKKQNLNQPKILELGVGSGAVVLSILQNCNAATATGVDINLKALEVAKENSVALNLNDLVEFKQSDWFANIDETEFDIIISNPPYIYSDDIPTLDKEVKDYEPIIALDGGKKGLDDYTKIIEQSPQYLKQNGSLILEIGYNQACDILKLFDDDIWSYKECLKDLAGNDRLIVAKL
ncbi:MAG: peptide chain release factor N(5)-glutamine methyltransferase [Proteobacteria bacterium]|nr:peptide chain release factor N(5)-glutamine methyltransferase [Pseudomonadota bacterium]